MSISHNEITTGALNVLIPKLLTRENFTRVLHSLIKLTAMGYLYVGFPLFILASVIELAGLHNPAVRNVGLQIEEVARWVNTFSIPPCLVLFGIAYIIKPKQNRQLEL